MPKNILIYFPYNHRTVEQQSVMEALCKKGHRVILYTNSKKGVLHDIVTGMGVIALAAEKEPASTFKSIWYNISQLKKIIRTYKVDYIIAHQQIPALTIGILRIFKKVKFAYVRHNSDEDYQNFPTKAAVLNKLTNFLTPVKIAPSVLVKKFWHTKEGIKKEAIRIINYGYNFSQYEKPNPAATQKIKTEYAAELLILSIARYVPQKRHQEMFTVIETLIKKGLDCKLVCLGSGHLENSLKEYVATHHLQNNIFIVGRKDNIFDYIAAADIFFHLSNSEASNSAVKEVALCNKPAIVCKAVGDFEDYISNNNNSFLVNIDNPIPESVQIFETIYSKAIDLKNIGERFNTTVTTTFDINNVVEKYEALINSDYR